MIEIKFNKKKKKGKKAMKQTPKNKIECSKKLAWFSAMCFAIVVVYTMLTFTYSIIADKMVDFTLLITLVTVSGAVFGVTLATYSNKSRYENVTRIQQSYLKFKYLMLRTIGSLDEDRVQQEIEDELSEIETDFDNEKSMANQEISYNN